MNLKLIDVKNAGDIKTEHLVIDCKEDTTFLGKYMVVKVNGFNVVINCIWLPDVYANVFDRIYIYTNKTEYKDVKITKYISMNLDKPLWTDIDKFSIVLIECKDWKFGYTFQQ